MGGRLTNTAVKNAKPVESGRPKKYSDGGGLHLLVNKSGKYWRYSYRYLDKQKTLALGVYPDVSLADARRLHILAREHLAKGEDPSDVKRRERLQSLESASNTFQALSEEWYLRQYSDWSPSYQKAVDRILKKDIYPYIGRRPIAELKAYEVLNVLKKMEARVGETTRRAQQICGQIFRYAVQSGKCERDVTADLKGAIKIPRRKHLSAITDSVGIGELLRAIDGYKGELATLKALQLAPLVFVRPANLRMMEWNEIDIEAALWTIPASKLKLSTEKKRANLQEDAEQVPLSKQSLAIIEDMRPVSGGGRYVFTSIRTKSRPMSENTLNAALRRLGFTSEEMTSHGFRSMASSQLNELGFRADVIEAGLFHKDKNTIRATYNRTSYLAERREMMQAWANHLDVLRQST